MKTVLYVYHINTLLLSFKILPKSEYPDNSAAQNSEQNSNAGNSSEYTEIRKYQFSAYSSHMTPPSKTGKHNFILEYRSQFSHCSFLHQTAGD
jgi:hypothetical protein